MTNEEALSILHCPDAYGGIYSEKYGEALSMAMETLKREPCEDCVSRQAVLSDIQSNWDWETVDGITATTVLKQVMTDITNALSVTPVRPKSEWISPKIALPEEDSFVLVTINARGRRRVRTSFYTNKLFMNDNGDTWRVTDKRLVAWMYSPEPCGAETELKTNSKEGE